MPNFGATSFLLTWCSYSYILKEVSLDMYTHLKIWFLVQEVRTSKRKCCCTARLPHAGEEHNLTRKSTLLNRPRKNEMGSSFEVLNIPHDNFLKFVSMSGLLTLLGTQEAIAASDIATGLQATSFFGDLGDISTGFASVRKIS